MFFDQDKLQEALKTGALIIDRTVADRCLALSSLNETEVPTDP
jgi:hypothetical protein